MKQSPHDTLSIECAIIDKACKYRINTNIGWQIAKNARIQFNLQVIATMGYHSLLEWGYYIVWLLSVAPEDSETDTAMEIYAAKTQYPMEMA